MHRASLLDAGVSPNGNTLGHQAEVLGKRVVVQHLPLGGIMAWNDISAPTMTPNVSANHIYSATPAPWASVTGTTVSAGSNDALMTASPRGYPSASIGGGGSELATRRINPPQNGP